MVTLFSDSFALRRMSSELASLHSPHAMLMSLKLRHENRAKIYQDSHQIALKLGRGRGYLVAGSP